MPTNDARLITRPPSASRRAACLTPKATPLTLTANVRSSSGPVRSVEANAQRLDAGVVHEDVERPKLLPRGVEHRRDLGFDRDIGRVKLAKPSRVPAGGPRPARAPRRRETGRQWRSPMPEEPPVTIAVFPVSENTGYQIRFTDAGWRPRGDHRSARRRECARRGSGERATRAFRDGSGGPAASRSRRDRAAPRCRLPCPRGETATSSSAVLSRSCRKIFAARRLRARHEGRGEQFQPVRARAAGGDTR